MVDDLGELRLPERSEAGGIDVHVVEGAEQAAGKRVAGADGVDQRDDRSSPLHRTGVVGVCRRALCPLGDDYERGDCTSPRMQTMKALVKREAGKGIWMEESPVPVPGPNEVLIKLEKTAICGTDLHIYLWDEWSQRTIKPGLRDRP